MKLPQTAAEVLRDHVKLEGESIDRMYLNVDVPQLQNVGGVVGSLHGCKGQRFASTAAVAPMTAAFLKSVGAFVAESGVDRVQFKKGQRKDAVTQDYLSRFKGTEGVLYVGKAQEKAHLMRTERRRNPRTGGTYPWIVHSTAMVNYVYFYCVDEDFGPFFLKFCTYFPYNAKLCLNGHGYAKCQLRNRGIQSEALDNGVSRCADPKTLQRICDGLSARRIDGLLRKWLRRLPHPFTKQDRKSGCRYDISILQAEFSLTQILDRPVMGRLFFEDVIRENLDIGRPGQVQLIFDRRIVKRTPGRFRTRVITDGVTPSLHVDYKHCSLKQYFKLLQGLRTETTINDTRDFAIGRRLHNLPALRQIGFSANRRLLDVQTISHDCALGEEQLQRHQRPLEVDGQRASALRFADPHTPALMQALLLFVLLPHGFSNADLRKHLSTLLGIEPSQLRPGRMTYDLRRLRLHGLIERVPRGHRYSLTEEGTKTAMFYSRVYNRILQPGLSLLNPAEMQTDNILYQRFTSMTDAVTSFCDEARLAA